MAVYRYVADNSIGLSRLRVEKSPDGRTSAYLIAQKTAQAETLHTLKESLSMAGFQCAPGFFNDEPALEITGIHDESSLIQHISSAAPELKNYDKDVLESDTLSKSEQAKRAALKIAGGFYLLGDAFYYTYGKVKDDAKKKALGTTNTSEEKPKGFTFSYDKAAAFAYAGGSASGFAFGKDPVSANLKHLKRGLIKEMKQVVRDLPEDSALRHFEVQQKGRNTLQQANDWLSRFPAEMLNLFIAGAGTFVMLAGLDEYKHHSADLKKFSQLDASNPMHLSQTEYQSSLKHAKMIRNLEALTGTTSLVVGVAGTLIKEDKTVDNMTDEEKAQRGFFQRMWDNIRKNPQKMVGYGLMVSTALHFALSAKTFTQAPKDIDAWRQKVKIPEDIATKDLMDATHKDGLMHGENWKKYGFSEREHAQSAVGNLTETVMGRKSFLFRLLFVLTNVVSEILISLSSKGHGAGVASKKADMETSSMISMAAEVVAKQRGDMQDAALQQAANYLASPNVLGIKREDAVKQLKEAVGKMAKNPWAGGKMVEQQIVANTSQNAGNAISDEVSAPTSAVERLERKPSHPRVNQTVESGLGSASLS